MNYPHIFVLRFIYVHSHTQCLDLAGLIALNETHHFGSLFPINNSLALLMTPTSQWI